MTFDRRTDCITSEVLGAFAEGRLGAEERSAVIAHLDTCDRCRGEVAVLGDFVDSAAEPAQPRRTWWWVAAAAVVIIVAAATMVFRRDSRPVAPLIAASAALDHRLVEPRLGGFAWAEYRPVRAEHGEQSPEKLKVLGAAGDVLQQAHRNPNAEAEHAAGVAELLIAQPVAAVDRLNAAIAKRPDDALAWNDLAAAHYDRAARLGRPSEYASALAAADHALKLDPRLAEALFNRALILERMGLIEDARAAWARYLDVDGGSAWAREARQRQQQLPRAARSSADSPQYARAFAEVELLGQWARAFRAGDRAAADELANARDTGAALQRRSGESLLAEAVKAIDDADDGERTRIADAHLLYRGGRRALSRHEAAAARDALLRAAALFGRDPAAMNARYFAAVAEYDRGGINAAGDELDALGRDLPPSFKALRAQTAWQRGLVDGKQARWPAALERYRQARTLFDELGETSNAAFVDALIGEAAILLGRHDEAWEGWTRALRALSEHGLQDRLAVTLGFISRTESMAGHDDAASSILDLEIAHANGDDTLRADALFRRAVASARLQDFAAARRAVDEGVRTANRIVDANARRQALGDLQLAEGVAFADDRRRALAMLTAAVEHDRAARPLRLPVALRERGRVLRALGRIDEATDDLRAAVDAIERQRADVEWRDVRATAIDGIDGIYTALAELLLERGRTEEAFAVADRAAAHAFYGAAAARSAMTVEELRRGLGRDAVVEYLTLPHELAIFVVTASSVAVERVAADDLRARVTALDEAIQKRGDVRGASLYPLLVSPVRDLIAGAETITFVPDPVLQSVPFSALFDAETGRWLIEEHTLRLAPAALGAAEPSAARGARIVVIQPPASDLPNAAAEAVAIAQRYRRSVIIDGRSPSAALAAMETADIIHYAGHTDSSGETGLALGQSTLYGADIARMHLREGPLVVLAGCRTLRGAGNGQDVATSLARAFLLAGARAVVGTEWDLDDRSAAAFFRKLHEANAAAGDAVAALREAQLAALSNSASQPADWAAAEIIVRSVLTERRKP